jgi:hypothetical protein
MCSGQLGRHYALHGPELGVGVRHEGA